MKEKILSRDTPFKDLIKPENLKKINIDSRLIPCFSNVMRRLQIFFERNNLLKASNYALLFEQLLMTDNINKFSIEIDSTQKETGRNVASGLFIPIKKKIIIDEDFFNANVNNDPMVLESTLTHEFIHFLSIATLPWIETKDGKFKQHKNYFQESFVYGGFINEGFTQLITELIYPHSLSYYPYTAMIKQYLNAFSTEDYFSFFRGRLPGKLYHSDNLDMFVLSAERHFQYKYNQTMSWEEEILQPYYQETFNLLVDAFKEKVGLEIERFEFATTEEFAERMFTFKALTIFESSYLDSGINQLITDYVDAYFPNVSSLKRFEFKQKISDIINNVMPFTYEPEIEGIYQIPKNKQGYHAKITNFSRYLLLEIYSPDNILLSKDKIVKMEGVAGKFNLTNIIAKTDMMVDFHIKDQKFYFKMYDAHLETLSKEEVRKLDKSEAPTRYSIELTNDLNNKEIEKIRRDQEIAFHVMNSVIDKNSYVAMDIVRHDESIVSVFEIKDIFKKDKNRALFLSTGLNDEIRYFYLNGNKYREVNQVAENEIKLPLSEDNEINISTNVQDGRLYIESSDSAGKIRSHPSNLHYIASKSYFSKISDIKNYQRITDDEYYQ